MASTPRQARHGRAILRGAGHDLADYAPQPENTPLEVYFTYSQAAIVCVRSKATVAEVVRKNNLKRYLVSMGPRRAARVLLPASTVRRVREILLGVP